MKFIVGSANGTPIRCEIEIEEEFVKISSEEWLLKRKRIKKEIYDSVKDFLDSAEPTEIHSLIAKVFRTVPMTPDIAGSEIWVYYSPHCVCLFRPMETKNPLPGWVACTWKKGWMEKKYKPETIKKSTGGRSYRKKEKTDDLPALLPKRRRHRKSNLLV